MFVQNEANMLKHVLKHWYFGQTVAFALDFWAGAFKRLTLASADSPSASETMFTSKQFWILVYLLTL